MLEPFPRRTRKPTPQLWDRSGTSLVESVRQSFPDVPALTLGAPVHEGRCHPESLVKIPLCTLNRHGLIAGATGGGKTRTLQIMAEQLSAQGVPVFLADMKGDLSGIGVPGEAAVVAGRVHSVGYDWSAAAFPVEFLSLTGERGAQLRATVESFGPLLFAKALDLNGTQTSVLSMVFKFCADLELGLLDLGDLRSGLRYMMDRPHELTDYGLMSKASVGVLLRQIMQLEQQGAERFFGIPAFDLDRLMVQHEGRGLVTLLELDDVQDRPALFSAFMMWMLARLQRELPEVGDVAKPKLVFFFDEAHLLFHGASRAFLDFVQRTVRLLRSKGVGLFFVTQSPKDVHSEVLAQLGHRVQHALRAWTPDDARALAAAARTYPFTPFYDVEAVLTTMGTGEALVTVLGTDGRPTAPVVTRMIPPASRMGPLTEEELALHLAASEQVRPYAHDTTRPTG